MSKEINNVIPDEFLPFIEGMVKEYNRHKKTKGESWKLCPPKDLYNLWYASTCKTFEDFENNQSHLFDVANFCCFLWCKLEYDKEMHGNL